MNSNRNINYFNIESSCATLLSGRLLNLRNHQNIAQDFVKRIITQSSRLIPPPCKPGNGLRVGGTSFDDPPKRYGVPIGGIDWHPQCGLHSKKKETF